MDLPKSAKLIINYMQLEHLVNNKQYLTFSEIVKGTGLSPRTVRKTLMILKNHGIIKALIDLSNSRRYLYRLVFKNIEDLCNEDVEPCLFLLDLGLGILHHTTFRFFKVLRISKLIYYTNSVPNKIFEYVKDNTRLINLINIDVNEFRSCVEEYVNNGHVVSIIFDSLLEKDVISKYINSIQDLDIPIKYVSSTSPIQIACLLLSLGLEKKLCYKRGNYIIRVITTKQGLSNISLSNVIKIFEIQFNGNKFDIAELSNVSEGVLTSNDDKLKAYVIYSLYT